MFLKGLSVEKKIYWLKWFSTDSCLGAQGLSPFPEGRCLHLENLQK